MESAFNAHESDDVRDGYDGHPGGYEIWYVAEFLSRFQK
jgi:hypothetical protein